MAIWLEGAALFRPEILEIPGAIGIPEVARRTGKGPRAMVRNPGARGARGADGTPEQCATRHARRRSWGAADPRAEGGGGGQFRTGLNRVTFQNAVEEDYDCRSLLQSETFRPLQDDAIYRCAHADPHRYGVIWNDEIDLAEPEIRLHGQDVE